MNEQLSFCTWPLRRIILIVFVIAALAGGAHSTTRTAQSGEFEQPATVDTVALPTPVAVYSDALCDGSAIVTDCATVEGNGPGPVISFGYGCNGGGGQ